MSDQDGSPSSSRRLRLNWPVLNRLKSNGANGASPSSAPLLPNPESLLHHLDNAIANTEYAQASHYLSLLFATLPSTPNSSASSSHATDSCTSHPKASVSATPLVSGESENCKIQKQTVSHLPFLKAVSRPTASRPTALSVSRFSPAQQETLSYSSPVCPSVILEQSKQGSYFIHSTVTGSTSSLWSGDSPHEAAADKKRAVAPVVAYKLPDELREKRVEKKNVEDVNTTHSEKRMASLEQVGDEDEPHKVDEFQNRSAGISSLFSGPLDGVQKHEGAADDKPSMGRWPLQFSSEADDNGVEDHDARAADEAYRAGCSALSEGNMELAYSLYKIASSKCPPDKHLALAKVQRLIAATSERLEQQETSKRAKKVVRHATKS